jgi:hypothetical protein
MLCGSGCQFASSLASGTSSAVETVSTDFFQLRQASRPQVEAETRGAFYVARTPDTRLAQYQRSLVYRLALPPRPAPDKGGQARLRLGRAFRREVRSLRLNDRELPRERLL